MKYIANRIALLYSRVYVVLNFISVFLIIILSLVSPAQAAACTATVATVTQTSAPIFYIDTPTYLDAYVSYRINTGASGSFTDLWVKVDTFTNTSFLGLAPTEDGLYHVGALASNSSASVYFYLKGAETASAQSYTLHLYNGKPSAGGTETCSSVQSNTSVSSTIESGNNTVNSVSYTAPYLGGEFNITILGTTGTIGSAGNFSYTPATQNTWNADCLELKRTNLTLTGGNTGTYTNGLFLTGLASGTTNYTLVYTFEAKCVAATSTPVVPLTYISSGNAMKHTSVSNYGSLTPIAPATNSLLLVKSVSPASSTAGGTATYYVNVTNNGPSAATLDDFTDDLPSTPAAVTYINGTSKYDDDVSSGAAAVTITNPTITGQNLQWVRSFSIPAGKTAQLSYQITIPSTAGSYVNRVVAHTGTTQIDQTADTTDNSPATATYGVGSLSLASSTKTGSDINGGSLQPGDIIQYTINAVASGTKDATGVRITDTIDTNTTSLSNIVIGASATNCGASYANSSTSTVLDITNITIAFGTTCQITFQVTVKATAQDGTTILNSASITSTVPDAIGGSPSSSPMIVRKDPILNVKIVENDADNVVIANQVVTYTTTITNTGQADANGVDLISTVSGPVGSLSSRTLSNCGSVYVDTSAGLSVNIAALAITMSTPCVITYTYTVNSGATTGSVDNSVDITAAREGGNDPAATSASTLLIGAAPTPPNLAVSVTDNDVDDYVSPGQTVTYTFSITNSGQTDATTSLTSAIPAGMGSPSGITYTNCGTPSSSYSSPTLTITSISIPAANICTISFNVNVTSPLDEGTQLILGVDVAAASQGGNNPANVLAPTLTVDATPILGVTFTENDADNTVIPSQDITYTLTITNTGNGSATIVGALDSLIGPASSPSNFSFTNCGTSYTNNSTTSFTVIDLTIMVGTPCVVTYHVTINSNATSGNTIANTIDVSAASEGGENPIPVAASTLTVSAYPDLAVTTSENDADNIVTPSQFVTYTTTITNSGVGAATGVSLVDTFSGSIASIGTFTLSGCGSSYTNNTSGSQVNITGLQISASGGVCTITYRMTVAANAAGNSTITNSADVSTATEGGNNPAAVSASTLTVAIVPNLSVTVEENDVDNIVTPNQTLTFVVTLSNAGNGTAHTSGTVTIPSELGSPSNIQYTNCGTASSSYTSPTLTLTNLTITTTNDCVIVFNATVKSPNTEGATFTVNADIATAAEGGNNPADEPSSTLAVDTTPNLLSSTYTQTDANGGTLKPGETLNYTLTIVNSGDGLASGVSVYSLLPSDVTFDPSTITFTNCGSAKTDNSTSAGLDIVGLEIAVGTNCVITFTATVKSPLAEGTVIYSTATVSQASQGGTGVEPSTGSLAIDATPNLSTSTYTISDLNGGTYKPGDRVGYTLTIKNTGDGSASGVSINDVLNIHTTLDTSTIVLTNCGEGSVDTSSATTLHIADVTVDVGTDCVIYFEVVTDSPLNEGTEIFETATVSSSSQGGSGATVSTTKLTIDATPNLSVAITEDDADDIVGLGQVVNTLILITNSGDGLATGVGLSYTLTSPGGSITSIVVTHCGSNFASSHTGTTITFTNLEISADKDCEINFAFTVSGSASNGATIDQSVDITGANEGGNNPTAEFATTLTVDVSNTAPYIPSNVVSELLSGNTIHNATSINAATLSADFNDPNTGDEVRYRIQFATDTAFNDVVIEYSSNFRAQGSNTYMYRENSGTYTIGSNATVLTDGPHYVRIRTEDDKLATSAWYKISGIAFTYDATPPVKPDPPFLIGAAGVGFATIGWDVTREPNPHPLIAYRIESSGSADFTSFTAFDTNDLSTLFLNLPTDAHRFFRIYWRDAAGNLSEASGILDVYIPAEATTPPETPTPEEPVVTRRVASSQPAATTTPVVKVPVTTLNAQRITTVVIITVKDQNGRAIENAKVTLRSEPRVSYTDNNGMVTFNNVSAGEHSATVEYKGTTTRVPVTLTEGMQELRMTILLKKDQRAKVWYKSWWWIAMVLAIIFGGLVYLYQRHKMRRKYWLVG